MKITRKKSKHDEKGWREAGDRREAFSFEGRRENQESRGQEVGKRMK